jgi:hypothetical protein
MASRAVWYFLAAFFIDSAAVCLLLALKNYWRMRAALKCGAGLDERTWLSQPTLLDPGHPSLRRLVKDQSIFSPFLLIGDPGEHGHPGYALLEIVQAPSHTFAVA